MTDKLPRVVGLEELLELRKPLNEKPAPLVYFSNREFAGLIKEAVELKRSSAPPLASFMPAPDGGGMVQQSCTSPEGQLCWGKWTPAGASHGSGVFFGCRCTGTKTLDPKLVPTCQLMLDSDQVRFRCTGTCEKGGCRLGLFRDPKTQLVILECACVGLRTLRPA